MLYYFMKSRSTTEMQKKKKKGAVCGEGVVTEQICQKWCAKYCWRFLTG